MAAINLYARTATSLSVQLTGLDTNYSISSPARYIAWWFNGSSYGSQYISNGISSSNPIEITGLSPSTSYSVGARVYYATYEGSAYSSVALTDQAYYTLDPPRPAYFYWSSYGTGYTPQNRTTYNSKYSIYRPSVAAWNALRTNIINMLVYKGVIVSANAFSSFDYTFPEATLNPVTPITAYLYNQAMYCIWSMGGSYQIVTQGSTRPTENYFYLLQYYLNQIT